MTPPMRVLICDDDALIGDALHDVLSAEPDMAVVGVARTAEDAIAMAERYAPDVAVVDVRMPGGGGLRVAREVRRRCPAVRLMAFSAHVDGGVVDQMRREGVMEYVVKGATNADIVATVRRLGRT